MPLMLFTLALLSAFQLNCFWSPHDQKRTFSIMLDPAGDTKNTGRVIEDSFERGLTLQFAEHLKKVLEEQNPGIRIVLTRFPGETVEPLQNANFANRLNVDLYLSIHFFLDKATYPKLYVYHFLYNPITDLWAQLQPFSFYSYDQAHLHSISTTILWGQLLKETLRQNQFKHHFEVKELQGLPFKPLVGIKAPALALEIGLKTKLDWKHYIEPVAYSINQIIQTQLYGN